MHEGGAKCSKTTILQCKIVVFEFQQQCGKGWFIGRAGGFWCILEGFRRITSFEIPIRNHKNAAKTKVACLYKNIISAFIYIKGGVVI